jgi:hypothetical protein
LAVSTAAELAAWESSIAIFMMAAAAAEALLTFA